MKNIKFPYLHVIFSIEKKTGKYVPCVTIIEKVARKRIAAEKERSRQNVKKEVVQSE